LISRHWKGIARRQQAATYVKHLKQDTFPGLRTIRGFVRASILRREVPQGIEFQIVTLWESLDAVRAFAGVDVEAAVVPTVVQNMMVEFDPRATHYEVVDVG
jgi:heme-degrading monooxygenase HmoA